MTSGGVGRVTIVGIGPAGPELITSQVRDAIAAIPHRFVRTERHPSAMAVPSATSFDSIYETAETFDDVYSTIVDELVAATALHGHVLYAVPGSPWVLERTVRWLGDDPRVETSILAGMSFLDLAYARLRIDPIEVGLRLIDGHRFAVDAAGHVGPLLVAHCHAERVLSDIKLAIDDAPAPDEPVVVLQRLGLPDERVFEIAWHELDRAIDADHLTSIFIPRLAAPVGASLARLVEITRELRAKCPWDRQQTHQSLAKYAVEETYELVDAITSGDDDDLIGELGDVLFQVVLHSALAEEDGRFSLAEVAATIAEKMIRRHPHVFAGLVVDGAEELRANWEAIKALERGNRVTGPFDGVSDVLPAALYASEVLKAAERNGIEQPIIDPLLAAVDAARRSGDDPEVALRQAALKYRRLVLDPPVTHPA